MPIGQIDRSIFLCIPQPEAKNPRFGPVDLGGAGGDPVEALQGAACSDPVYSPIGCRRINLKNGSYKMLNIALIAGDGIGPEVCEEGLKCLDALASKHAIAHRVTRLPYSGQRYLETEQVISDEEVADLKQGYDAIYLGAVGRPDVPPGVLERGLLLKLRFELDQYINLRPVKLYPGISTPLAGKTPEDIDFVVVRENTEDLYCGVGGFLRKDTPHEVATQEMIATRMGVERCLRYAFDLCRARDQRKELTLVGKTNVLTFAHDLWMRAFEQIGEQYPDIKRQYHHVDACCMFMVTKPQVYDVIVTTNMFGDIITDLGAAIAGGMGIAASGNLNPAFGGAGSSSGDADSPGETSGGAPGRGSGGIGGTASPGAISGGSGGPSMFEPVHGSAPDIAGEGKANPLAAILSMAMLLQQTGLVKGDSAMTAAGDALEEAVAKVCPRFEGKNLDRTGMGTTEVTDLVLAEL